VTKNRCYPVDDCLVPRIKIRKNVLFFIHPYVVAHGSLFRGADNWRVRRPKNGHFSRVGSIWLIVLGIESNDVPDIRAAGFIHKKKIAQTHFFALSARKYQTQQRQTSNRPPNKKTHRYVKCRKLSKRRSEKISRVLYDCSIRDFRESIKLHS